MFCAKFLSRLLSATVFYCAMDSAPAAEEIAVLQRERIRVGGNVQESKLIRRVELIYPEEARAARLSGVVILQATINESGEVTELKVLRGHPLLDQAALDAVKQWQYKPTYLNGEAIPVIATVSVVFNLSGSSNLRVMIDQSGNLRDSVSGLQGDALMRRIKGTDGGILVQPDPRIPFRALEEILRSIEQPGVQRLQMQGPYLFRGSRLYYWVASTGSIRMQSETPGNFVSTRPPKLTLDLNRLASLAGASGQVENIPRAGDGRRVLLYRLFVNEVAEIVAVEPLRGPKISELESELARTRVIAPGLFGNEPVAMAVAIEVPVP